MCLPVGTVMYSIKNAMSDTVQHQTFWLTRFSPAFCLLPLACNQWGAIHGLKLDFFPTMGAIHGGLCTEL